MALRGLAAYMRGVRGDISEEGVLRTINEGDSLVRHYVVGVFAVVRDEGAVLVHLPVRAPSVPCVPTRGNVGAPEGIGVTVEVLSKERRSVTGVVEPGRPRDENEEFRASDGWTYYGKCLNNAYHTVERDDWPDEERKRVTLEILKEMQQEASDYFLRYRWEVGLRR